MDRFLASMELPPNVKLDACIISSIIILLAIWVLFRAHK